MGGTNVLLVSLLCVLASTFSFIPKRLSLPTTSTSTRLCCGSLSSTETNNDDDAYFVPSKSQLSASQQKLVDIKDEVDYVVIGSGKNHFMHTNHITPSVF